MSTMSNGDKKNSLTVLKIVSLGELAGIFMAGNRRWFQKPWGLPFEMCDRLTPGWLPAQNRGPAAAAGRSAPAYFRLPSGTFKESY
jgi:hypothetical protein